MFGFSNFLLIFSLSLNDLWEVSMGVRSIVLFDLKIMCAKVFLQMPEFFLLFFFLIYLKISVLIHTPLWNLHEKTELDIISWEAFWRQQLNVFEWTKEIIEIEIIEGTNLKQMFLISILATFKAVFDLFF